MWGSKEFHILAILLPGPEISVAVPYARFLATVGRTDTMDSGNISCNFQCMTLKSGGPCTLAWTPTANKWGSGRPHDRRHCVCLCIDRVFEWLEHSLCLSELGTTVFRGILSRAAEFARFRGISIFLRNFVEFSTDATNMPYFDRFQAAIDN